MVHTKRGISVLVVTLSLAVTAYAATTEKFSTAVQDKTVSTDWPEDNSESAAKAFFNEESSTPRDAEACYDYCDRCSDNCCQGGWRCCNPRWTVTADALILHRSATRSQRLLLDPQGETDLLNSSDMAFSFAAGPRLSLIRHGSCNWDFELNYFGIDGWGASADFPNTALPSGFGILVVDNALTLPVENVGFEEHSRLYSSEFNIRRPINDWLTPLVGFRWVELSDNYRAQGTEFVELSPFSHEINTHNHLYGFQIGADASLKPTCRFHIDGLIKAGIFGNAANQTSSFSDPASDLSATASGSHTAFLGELGLIGTYQLTKHAALRGGYQVMWIAGVALAPTQIPSTNLGGGTASIETSGNLFYHGATVGLDITW